MQPPADMVVMWLQGTITCGISLLTFAAGLPIEFRDFQYHFFFPTFSDISMVFKINQIDGCIDL